MSEREYRLTYRVRAEDGSVVERGDPSEALYLGESLHTLREDFEAHPSLASVAIHDLTSVDVDPERSLSLMAIGPSADGYWKTVAVYVNPQQGWMDNSDPATIYDYKVRVYEEATLFDAMALVTPLFNAEYTGEDILATVSIVGPQGDAAKG